jgi:hypothetical protein
MPEIQSKRDPAGLQEPFENGWLFCLRDDDFNIFKRRIGSAHGLQEIVVVGQQPRLRIGEGGEIEIIQFRHQLFPRRAGVVVERPQLFVQ